MTPMLPRPYNATSPRVIAIPNQKNSVSGANVGLSAAPSGPWPKNQAPTNERARVRTAYRIIEFFGVLYTGWTSPSHFGRAPARPIENHTLVAALAPEMPTASTLLMIART